MVSATIAANLFISASEGGVADYEKEDKIIDFFCYVLRFVYML